MIDHFNLLAPDTYIAWFELSKHFTCINSFILTCKIYWYYYLYFAGSGSLQNTLCIYGRGWLFSLGSNITVDTLSFLKTQLRIEERWNLSYINIENHWFRWFCVDSSATHTPAHTLMHPHHFILRGGEVLKVSRSRPGKGISCLEIRLCHCDFVHFACATTCITHLIVVGALCMYVHLGCNPKHVWSEMGLKAQS